LRRRIGQLVSAQRRAQRVDALRRPIAEILEGAVLDLAVFAIAFPSRMAGGEPRLGTMATYLCWLNPAESRRVKSREMYGPHDYEAGGNGAFPPFGGKSSKLV
jgi:hypothetical protein